MATSSATLQSFKSFCTSTKGTVLGVTILANIILCVKEYTQIAGWMLEFVACFLVGFVVARTVQQNERDENERAAIKKKGTVSSGEEPSRKQSQLESWSRLIYKHSNAGNPQKAENVLDEMCAAGVPPKMPVFSTIIRAWLHKGDFVRAEKLMDKAAFMGIQLDTQMCNIVMTAYAKKKDVKNAERWFHKMTHLELVPDVCTYDVLINASAKARSVQRAVAWLQRMQTAGFMPSIISFSCVLDACALTDNFELGKHVFARMISLGEDIELNAVPFTCMARLHAHRGEFLEVERLFRDMVNMGIAMNEYTLCMLMVAYGRTVPRQCIRAQEAFRSAVRSGCPVNSKVFNALRHVSQSEERQQELERFAEEYDVVMQGPSPKFVPSADKAKRS